MLFDAIRMSLSLLASLLPLLALIILTIVLALITLLPLKQVLITLACEPPLISPPSPSLSECRQLMEGEIFVSLGGTVLEADVLVTRFPCYHPGDVRRCVCVCVYVCVCVHSFTLSFTPTRLRAVNIPELHSLPDVCIVPVTATTTLTSITTAHPISALFP
jgi:hypothetical protein